MEELDAPFIALGKNKEQTHDGGVFMLELWTNILDKSDRYSRVMIFKGILTRDSLNRWATSFLKHTSLFRSWLWHFAQRPSVDTVRSGWARLNWDVVCQIVRVSTYKCKIIGIQESLSTSTFFLLNPKTQIFWMKVVWCQSLACGVGCGHGLVMVEYITPRSPLMDSYLKFYILNLKYPIQDSEHNLIFF